MASILGKEDEVRGRLRKGWGKKSESSLLSQAFYAFPHSCLPPPSGCHWVSTAPSEERRAPSHHQLGRTHQDAFGRGLGSRTDVPKAICCWAERSSTSRRSRLSEASPAGLGKQAPHFRPSQGLVRRGRVSAAGLGHERRSRSRAWRGTKKKRQRRLGVSRLVSR